jgi:hypothetical protein
VSSSSSLVIVSRGSISFHAHTSLPPQANLSFLTLSPRYLHLSTWRFCYRSKPSQVALCYRSNYRYVDRHSRPGLSHNCSRPYMPPGRIGNGALASLAYRKPGSCVDKTGFRWYICVEGEILITTDERLGNLPAVPPLGQSRL